MTTAYTSIIHTSLEPSELTSHGWQIHDCGDINAVGDEDAHVITVNSYCSNVWLLDNTMHTASGTGLQILASAGNGHNTHNIYAGNNEVYNVRQSGMWVKTGKDIVFSGNHVHDINALEDTVGPIEIPITSWQPAAIHLHGAHDHYIYNNLIFDAPNGIDTTGAGISKIRNNILLDVTESQADGRRCNDCCANESNDYHHRF
jgi:hypothetical protein